jgi:hypothetical protein
MGVEIKLRGLMALLALAIIPAGLAQAGTSDIGPVSSGSSTPTLENNPRSVDAAAMANVPCYFQNDTILMFDLDAGPARAQDPAQAASASRVNDAGVDATCLPLCGGLGIGGGCSIDSYGIGAGGAHGKTSATPVNTYGNSGW